VSVAFVFAMSALMVAPLVAWALERAGALLALAGCVLLAVVGIDAALAGARPVLKLGTWLGFGSSDLRATGLAGLFLALTGLTGGATALAHAGSPAGRGQISLGAALLLCATVVIGADNGFLLLIAWEGLTVCVYLIANGDRRREELLAGYLTGGLAKLGGAALLAALGILYAHTHSFSLAAWAHADLSPGVRGVLSVLFLACFATKVGVLPLQGGLPSGYGAARRLGAAWLSVALCAGFYGLVRFEVQVLAPLPAWCGDMLLILGALTALAGIVYALTEDDLRRFLGYSTVEHSGIVLIGLGVAILGQSFRSTLLAAAGLLAATLHIGAHGLAKTLALITIDGVERASGERTIDPLGGLSRLSPAGALAGGVASLTLAAIPPLGGFVSEWFTFQALLQSFRMPSLLSQLLSALAGVALALTAGLGLLAFARFYSFTFLGPRRGRLGDLAPGARRSLGALLLAFVLLLLGAAAPWEIHLLGTGLQGVLGINLAATTISHPLVLTPVFTGFAVLDPTWLSVTLLTLCALAFAVARATRGRGLGASAVRREPVWVTGSGAELAAVQYRPSAYSNPMRVILRGPLGYRAMISPQPGGPAGDLRLETRVVLAVDRFLYRPAAASVRWAADRARAIQNGRLSAYLLYILAALLAAISLIPILR